jgi:hypothetical protein
MTKLIEMLRKLEQDRFFGNVTLQFRAGDIEVIRKEETIKLHTQRDTYNEPRNR